MRILLIDVNNAVARNSHAFPTARSRNGFPTGGLYGMVMQLRAFIGTEPFDAVVGCIDRGVPKFRSEICPEYKAQRGVNMTEEEKQQRDNYKKQVKVAHEVLVPLGITTARAKNWEGDDVIAALALRRFRAHDVAIWSSDRDFRQLLDYEHVSLYDAHNKRWAEREPHFCLKRCLDPKDSDNLDGVPGVGPAKAEKLVANWAMSGIDVGPTDPGYVDSFLEWCARVGANDATGFGKLCRAVDAEKQKVRANWRCTHMPGIAKECDEQLKFRRAAPDKKAFLAVCADYDLKPLVQDMSSLWPPFLRLTGCV